MNPRDHQLFKQYPLNGKATLSTGAAPTPYHIYNGYGAFIGGTADLAAVQRLLQPEQVIPVQTVDGRALMGLWICDFTDASLGAHHELQCSLFVARQPINDIASHPLALLAAMLARPEMQMMCHGLWNNTPTVVAYNRELLSLNAQLSSSVITLDRQQMRFEVRDAISNLPILAGAVSKPDHPAWRASFALLGQLGVGPTFRITRQPWVQMAIVNPVGVRLPHNAVAQAMTKNDTNTVRYFDPAGDTLTFGATPYRDLGFRPQFVQHMRGFKFVYLKPT
jgi:hypothetical protein